MTIMTRLYVLVGLAIAPSIALLAYNDQADLVSAGTGGQDRVAALRQIGQRRTRPLLRGSPNGVVGDCASTGYPEPC